MKSESIQILLVEDDAGDAIIVKKSLQDADSAYSVHWEQTMSAAVDTLKDKTFDLILVDLSLPDCEGRETVNCIRNHAPNCPVVVVTGLDDKNLAVELLDAGAQDYFVKGNIGQIDLERSIQYAMQRHENLMRTRELLAELETKNQLLVSKNSQLAKLYAQAHEFVDNVSHEFRTPLTVIKEYVSLVHEGIVGEVNDEQCRLLQVAEDRTDDLNIMVDDMLDISKLEAGMLGTRRKQCDANEFLNRVQGWLARKADVKSVHLIWNIDEDLPPVYCDPEKISRVLTNLAINSIKFCSNPGRVQIGATSVPEKHAIRISVTDNGNGMNSESLQKIFQRFKQLDNSVHSSTKGFGLGLSIAKQLVDLHFGELDVESEPGVGSTFSFTVPTYHPAEIFKRYLNQLIRTSGKTKRHANVSLALIETEWAEENSKPEVVDSFLYSCLRAHDLIFRRNENSWLVALPESENEVEMFFDRIEEERESKNRNLPNSKIAPLQTKLLCSQPLHQSRQPVIDAFASWMTGSDLDEPNIGSQATHPGLGSHLFSSVPNQQVSS